MPAGRVELISTDFVLGWAESREGCPTYLHAALADDVVGSGAALMKRLDLHQRAGQGGAAANAFVILFEPAIDASLVPEVKVFFDHSSVEVPRAPKFRIDRYPRQRVFVFGSPRSGTSQLGDTIATHLELPWLGEGHAAPLFAKAADALTGDSSSPNGLIRFMAQQNYREIAIKAARTSYYFMHASGSFLDKTPGHPMISAAPFLLECFPDAKFVFLYRNGISNVLSRLAKFGGDFNVHCADWAAAMREWIRVRQLLPHFLEIEQEVMLTDPTSVAASIASYLDVPEKKKGISNSLGSGSRERTGAGVGRTALSQTGWSIEQIDRFQRICGPMMEAFSYKLET